MDDCSAPKMFYNQKDLHAKSELGRGHACGRKRKDEKDEKDERLDEYFGTLRTPWLVMNINILGEHCIALVEHKYLDLSERIEHSEGDGGSEQEIRQGEGEYEDVSDCHYYQTRYP